MYHKKPLQMATAFSPRKSMLSKVLTYLLIVGLGWGIFAYTHINGKSDPLQNETIVDVKKGMALSTLAKKLENERIIKSERWFLSYLKMTNKDMQIKAGRYAFNGPLSLKETVDILTNKEQSQQFIKFTVPEGFSIKDIAGKLESQGLATAEAFESYVNTHAKQDFMAEFPWLADNPTSNMEGYLFPDTYFFSAGTSIKSIVASMLKQTETKLMPLFQESPPKKRYGFHRMLTIASIIQKEAGTNTEMPIISSVFFNRLRQMKRLESCPTILYAIGDPDKTTLTFHDLDLKSPYNTYRVFGLPPTPIASPGIAAFKATLYPPKTDYMFFVSNNDGTHTFSKTYKEHLRAQKRINATTIQ